MADTNLNGGFNSAVVPTGEALDELLRKIKNATVATDVAPGEGGFIPAPPAGSQDGSKVLNSKLEWADADAGSVDAIDISIFSSTSGTITDEQYQTIVDAYNKKSNIVLLNGSLMSAGIGFQNDDYSINVSAMTPMGAGSFYAIIFNISIKPDKTYTSSQNFLPVNTDYFKYLNFVVSAPVTVTTLANIPNKHNVIANVTAATDLSVSPELLEGMDIQVRVNNTSGAVITQTIPTTGAYDCLDGTSVEIPARGFVELNIWKIGGVNVIRIGQKQ